ncbi:MAG: SUMF1/EgtB/PvdO family nonheme iron enzyme [Myxococcales bacterium]|nr:SUMF1/EgtB/PvdO family nonheme iron enzyme [Myxococcales bacterium]
MRVFFASSLLFAATWGPDNLAAPAGMGAPPPLVEESEPHYRALQSVNAQPRLASFASEEIGPTAARPMLPTRHEWGLFDGRYWQIHAKAPAEDVLVTDRAEGTRGACGPGMVEVKGKMRVHGLLDMLQNQACTKWITRTFPERCAEFDRDKWRELSKDLPTESLHFCIDRFEYPNQKGVFPVVMASWYEADQSCRAQGKRLCTENEWTFACEGEEAMPYPTGYKRDAEACVIDRPWVKYDDAALIPRNTPRAMRELDRLWQGQTSGSSPGCKSPFGVHDMTGNVDEWTRSSIPGERPSVLKGGYWGPVRTRCRPATKAHGETHTFYQQGFRCCAGAP